MGQMLMTASPTKSYYNKGSDTWKNFKEQIEYLKTSLDPHYLLESLGVVIDKETPKEIRGACPIHSGDNKTAFRFNKDRNTWVCFTHKCHESHGNDVIGLIKAITGKTFVEALEHLKQLVGDINSADFLESKRRREMDSFVSFYSDSSMPSYINELSLMRHRPYRSSLFIRDGFSNKTLDHFEVAGGWKDKQGIIRDIIPIRDDKGILVAYSLRDTRENAGDDKYTLTPGFDKQRCIYNLNIAQKYADKLPLIVVEGFKSVWRLHDYGIKNVIAVMGSNITEGQQMLLCAYANKGVVVMFDNDIAGVTGIVSAIEDLGNKMDVRPVFIQEIDKKTGKGLDPSDLNKEQVYEYLDSYFILED